MTVHDVRMMETNAETGVVMLHAVQQIASDNEITVTGLDWSSLLGLGITVASREDGIALANALGLPPNYRVGGEVRMVRLYWRGQRDGVEVVISCPQN